MSDFWDFTKEVLLPVAILILTVVVIIFIVGHLHMKYSCNRHQDITGIETKYVPLSACYLNTEDGWVTYEDYKQRNIAKTGLSKIGEKNGN